MKRVKQAKVVALPPKVLGSALSNPRGQLYDRQAGRAAGEKVAHGGSSIIERRRPSDMRTGVVALEVRGKP